MFNWNSLNILMVLLLESIYPATSITMLICLHKSFVCYPSWKSKSQHGICKIRNPAHTHTHSHLTREAQTRNHTVYLSNNVAYVWYCGAQASAANGHQMTQQHCQSNRNKWSQQPGLPGFCWFFKGIRCMVSWNATPTQRPQRIQDNQDRQDRQDWQDTANTLLIWVGSASLSSHQHSSHELLWQPRHHTERNFRNVQI